MKKAPEPKKETLALKHFLHCDVFFYDNLVFFKQLTLNRLYAGLAEDVSATITLTAVSLRHVRVHLEQPSIG